MMARVATNGLLELHVGRLIALLAAGLLGGCNASSNDWPMAHVRGKVTIDGQPVPGDVDARIMFIPLGSGDNRNAKPATAQIVNGRYDAPEVPIGPLLVRFDVMQSTGRDLGRGMVEFIDLVPEEHRQGIRVEFAEGEHSKDFDL